MKVKKEGGFSWDTFGQISNNEIPDTTNTRLVFLAAQYSHQRGVKNSDEHMLWIKECLKIKEMHQENI